MTNPFFERPILNSPYENPQRHWELDHQGQPTQKIIEARRRAEFITPIPKPRKRKSGNTQQQIVFDEGKGLSTETQAYDPTSIINEVRQRLASWRTLPSPFDWQVTPETARLLQHWRSHKFNSIRPFFCQVEAVETAIWLSEVAPQSGTSGKALLEHLANANNDANPELLRLALKLATGAGETTGGLSGVVEMSGVGSASASESSSSLLALPDGSSCALDLSAFFTDGNRVNEMALANLDGITVSTLRASRVACEGERALTSRVICSKSVGSRSDQGKFVSNALMVQSPLFGNSF